MSSLLTKISEETFDQLKYVSMFPPTEFDRSFGVISKESKNYRISWQSDIVDPVIKEIKQDIYGVGIDLNFAILDFRNNSIVFKTHFDCFFIDFLVFDPVIYVVTEMKIIEVSLKDYKLRQEHDLPDVYESSIAEKNYLIVKCLDGSIVKLKVKADAD